MDEQDRRHGELAALASSDDPADVDRAHEQALIRMRELPSLKVVAALAYDRTRAFAGREQKFGTQAVVSAGKRTMWPVDPGTTDSERAKWLLEGLDRLRAQVAHAPEITKGHLRRVLRQRRAGLTQEKLQEFAERIAEHGGGSIAVAKQAVIAAYWPLPGEADPRPLARQLARQTGVRLVLPVVNGHDMTFREWCSDEDLEPAGFGTFGPAATATELQPSIILTPLVGFDGQGGRLGQGKGYYDRKLAPLDGLPEPFVVGIASSCQQVPLVPTERHDRRLDLVITELGVTKFGD